MSTPRAVPKSVTNELTGASSFFKSDAALAPEAKPQQPSEQPSPTDTPTPEESRTSTPGEPRTPVRPVRVVKRQMIRHPFELYMDQIERLREAAQTDRQQGGAGSMSKMVREAIDAYLDHLPTFPD